MPSASYSQSREVNTSATVAHQSLASDELEWNKLLGRAGVPNNGLLLTARTPTKAVDLTKPNNLVLSLQNVSDHRITVAGFRGDLPYALVRDKHGTTVPFSKEGARRCSSGVIGYYAFSKRDVHVLDPGQANGYVLAIDTLCMIDSPGEYEAIVVDAGLGCAAKPVSFSVVKGANKPTPAGWQRAALQSEFPSHVFGPEEPTDRDWAQLESLAGKALEGMVLDAMASPVSPGAVVVSIRGNESEPTVTINAPNSAMDASNYWLLVRDSSGRAVPMNEKWKSNRSEKSLCGRGIRLYPGSAIGTAIQIAELFDLKSPEVYSVLIALPSSDRKGPVWVTGLMKFRVAPKLVDTKN